jgi:nucleotide-binding universal stress UspA family protein
MKSIIVHIHDDSGLEGRLAVALDLCRAHDAHLTCLHMTPYGAYAAFDPAGGMFTSGILLETPQKQQDDLQVRIAARMANEDMCWDWQSYDGDVAQSLVAASSLADLVVLGQAGPAKGDATHPLAIVDAVAVNAGCAVLVVPTGCKQIDPTAPVVIGWNASEEAARTIRQSLPALKLASAVHLVSIDDEEEDFPQMAASAYLSRHGIASELHALKRGKHKVDEQLHQFAIEQGAGTLLIGAYGHSRLRETLLGGVTRYLTMQSQLPLMLGR